MSDAKSEPKQIVIDEHAGTDLPKRLVKYIEKSAFDAQAAELDKSKLLNAFYLDGLEKAQSELANLKAEVSGLRNILKTADSSRIRFEHNTAEIIEKLEAERDRLKEFNKDRNFLYELAESRKREISTLQSKCEIYEAALKFYADRDNWSLATAQSCSAMIGGDDHIAIAENKFVGGQIARQALQDASKIGSGE